jgi:hypothetical protein
MKRRQNDMRRGKGGGWSADDFAAYALELERQGQ